MQRYLLFWEKVWATCHTLSQYKKQHEGSRGLHRRCGSKHVKYQTKQTFKKNQAFLELLTTSDGCALRKKLFQRFKLFQLKVMFNRNTCFHVQTLRAWARYSSDLGFGY